MVTKELIGRQCETQNDTVKTLQMVRRKIKISFCLLQDFISQWSLGHETGSEEASGSQLGLAWLIPLWVDRDPEVRAAQQQSKHTFEHPL